jgi:hypothetical protein
MRFQIARLAATAALVACWFLPVTAQQASDQGLRKSLTFGFVSPNTREGLKLDDAIRGLSSSEEDRLIRQARAFGCVAQSKIETLKAVGSWSDGAEHSVMIRVQTDAPTMRYIVAVLGRDSRQKATLYFHSDAAGSADLYTLRPQGRESIRRLSTLLDEAGIEFRTLVPTKPRALVYVVDSKRELRAKIVAAAKRLKARVMSRRGSAEFIGDDSSREKATTIFDEEIRNYETQHSALITKCRMSNSSPAR